MFASSKKKINGYVNVSKLLKNFTEENTICKNSAKVSWIFSEFHEVSEMLRKVTQRIQCLLEMCLEMICE